MNGKPYPGETGDKSVSRAGQIVPRRNRWHRCVRRGEVVGAAEGGIIDLSPMEKGRGTWAGGFGTRERTCFRRWSPHGNAGEMSNSGQQETRMGWDAI